jgi:hypothetical protein
MRSDHLWTMFNVQWVIKSLSGYQCLTKQGINKQCKLVSEWSPALVSLPQPELYSSLSPLIQQKQPFTLCVYASQKPTLAFIDHLNYSLLNCTRTPTYRAHDWTLNSLLVSPYTIMINANFILPYNLIFPHSIMISTELLHVLFNAELTIWNKCLFFLCLSNSCGLYQWFYLLCI